MILEDIALQIKQRPHTHKPIIIAVEGFGGAGKSTFAMNLKNELGEAFVIEIDDFFIKEKVSDADKSNFDRERLKEQIILPLKKGQTAVYQKLDYVSNKLSDFINVPEVKYLIIEGVSSFHPDLADYIDYKIWVDTPGELAKMRGSKRDKERGVNNDHLWDHWTKTYQDYKDMHQPDKMADFIFNTSN